MHNPSKISKTRSVFTKLYKWHEGVIEAAKENVYLNKATLTVTLTGAYNVMEHKNFKNMFMGAS